MPRSAEAAMKTSRTASRRVKREKAARAAGKHWLSSRIASAGSGSDSSRETAELDLARRHGPSCRGESRPITLPRSLRSCRAGLGDRGTHQVAQLVLAERRGQELRQRSPPPRAPSTARSSRPAFSYASIDSRRCLTSFARTPSISSSVSGRRLCHLRVVGSRKRHAQCVATQFVVVAHGGLRTSAWSRSGGSTGCSSGEPPEWPVAVRRRGARPSNRFPSA